MHLTSSQLTSPHRSSVATVARAMVSRDFFPKRLRLHKNHRNTQTVGFFQRLFQPTKSSEYDNWLAILEQGDIDRAAIATGD
jgi:hypothetical protein